MATPVFCTGFEHGAALVAGNGNGLAIEISGSPSVTAAAARTGNYGLRCAPSSGSMYAGLCNPNSQTVVGSFYWLANSMPAADTKLLYFWNGTGEVDLYYDVANSKLRADYTDYTGADKSKLSLSTVTTATWYRIEFKMVQTGTTWTFDWKIDGTDQTQAFITGQSATSITIVGLGARSGSAVTCSWDFDDLVISTTAGDYPLGQYQVIGSTASSAAAEHQSIVTSEVQYTDDFSAFTNLASTTETDSYSRINDLATGDGIRLYGSLASYTLPVLRAAGAKSDGTTGTVTVAAPTGVATGDLEILIVETTTSASITNNGGSAWTAFTGSPKTETAARALYIWYRIRQAGDGSPIVQATADQICASRLAYQTGTFDAAAPIANITSSSEATVDTSFSWAPGFSTGRNNCLVLCCATTIRDSTTVAVPQMTNSNLTSLAARGSANTNNGNGGGYGCTEGALATAGAVGTFACTYSTTSSAKTYFAWTIQGAPAYGGALTGNLRYPTAVTTTSPGTVPAAVSFILAGGEASAGTNDCTVRTYLGGSTTNHFTGDPGWTTAQYLRYIMTAKPGGGAWADSDIANIKTEIDTTDCNPSVYIYGFFYEIAYPVSSGTTYTKAGYACENRVV